MCLLPLPLLLLLLMMMTPVMQAQRCTCVIEQ